MTTQTYISDIADRPYYPHMQKPSVFDGKIDTLEEEVEQDYMSTKNRYESLLNMREQVYSKIKDITYSTSYFARAFGPIGRFFGRLFKGGESNLNKLQAYRKKLDELDNKIYDCRKIVNYHVHKKIREEHPHLEREVEADDTEHKSTLDVANRYAQLLKDARKYLGISRKSHLLQTYLPITEIFAYSRMRKLRSVINQINDMKKRYSHILKMYYPNSGENSKISKSFLSKWYLLNPFQGWHYTESYLQDKNLNTTESQLYYEESLHDYKKEMVN